MTSSNNNRQGMVCLAAVLLLVLPGCLTTRPERGSDAEKAAGSPGPRESRLQASRALTGQARLLLERGRPEGALRLLERAVGLGPQDGETYYWLAEAWIAKDDPAQALEYHRLAVRYLQANPDWPALLSEQQERITALQEQ